MWRRLLVVLTVALLAPAASATVVFSFITTNTSCDVGNGETVTPCPFQDALPGSVALLPLSVSLGFTDESVASGFATFANIETVVASAGSELAWTLSDLDPALFNLGATFSENRTSIVSFFSEARSVTSPTRDYWGFGTRLPNGATLDFIQINPHQLAVLNDIVDPVSGQFDRLGAVRVTGFFTSDPLQVAEPDSWVLFLFGLCGIVIARYHRTRTSERSKRCP